MNILLTNVRVNGQDLSEDGITDVMVFADLTADQLAAAYHAEGTISFDDCYAVPDNDVAYYLYEPCTLTHSETCRALELAAEKLMDITGNHVGEVTTV